MTRIGTVISFGDPALAELAATPLDFVWLDLEHGALTVRDVQPLTIAAQAAGASVLVRVPAIGSESIQPSLDCGVDGIVAPKIESANEAAALVHRLRFPPHGSRGFGPRRAGGYGRAADFARSEAARVECVVQVESPAGVEAAHEIAVVPGVDAVVVGCADLSLALGAPGDLGSADLAAACDGVASAAANGGIAWGLAAGGDVADVAQLARRGPDLLLYSADVRLYAAAVDAAVARLKAALGGARAAA